MTEIPFCVCPCVCVYETERETTAEGDRERWLDKRTVLENAIIRFPFQQLTDAGLRTGDCSTAKKHTHKKKTTVAASTFL